MSERYEHQTLQVVVITVAWILALLATGWLLEAYWGWTA